MKIKIFLILLAVCGFLVLSLIDNTGIGKEVSSQDIGKEVSPKESAKSDPICGAGFAAVPADLKEKYAKQSLGGAGQTQVMTRGKEYSFFGITYRCSVNDEDPRSPNSFDVHRYNSQQVNFVSNSMNEIVRSYIRAVIYNEIALDTIYPLVSNGPLSKSHQVNLCVDTTCNPESTSTRGLVKYNYANIADLKYSRTVSDDFLAASALNRLRALDHGEEVSDPLGDPVLNDFLDVARRIAMSRVKENHQISLEKWDQ